MIKALSLAVALSLSASAPALTQDTDTPTVEDVCTSDAFVDIDVDIDDDGDAKSPAMLELEAAAEAFGERMKTFDARAKPICVDAGLSETDKQTRIAALWGEYEPDVQAFAATAASLGPRIAAEALAEIDIGALTREAVADIDVEAVTAEAMAEVQASGALQGALGVARNSAWTSGDPEHMETLGLAAEYAIGEAADAQAEAEAEPSTPER